MTKVYVASSLDDLRATSRNYVKYIACAPSRWLMGSAAAAGSTMHFTTLSSVFPNEGWKGKHTRYLVYKVMPPSLPLKNKLNALSCPSSPSKGINCIACKGIGNKSKGSTEFHHKSFS